MITLSDRYSIVLTCAVALLSVFVVYHFVESPQAVSCQDPGRLINERFLPSVTEFDVVPWKRKLLINGSKGKVALEGVWNKEPDYRIARTYNLGDYYFMPIDNFTNMLPGDLEEVSILDINGSKVPVHVRLDESEKESVLTTYVYFLGGKPIRNPFTGSLAQTASHLRHGAHPLTMILLNGRTSFDQMETNREVMLDWMRDAVVRYGEVCGT